jgi:acetyl esterase/lipase
VLRLADAIWRLDEGRLETTSRSAEVKQLATALPTTRPGGDSTTRALSSFTYTREGIPDVRVWIAAPPSVDPQTQLVVVMHGVLRNAREYAAEWADWAARSGHVVAAPQFEREAWGGAAGYNLGNVLRPDGALNPVERWSFTVVDEIQARVRQRLGIADERFILWGHSAGAQFAHRFPLFRPQARFRAVIVAGCGWFTLPDPDVEFPYGAKHPLLAFSRRQVLRWTRRRLVLVRGELDLEQDANLRTTPEALAQGANRFERAASMLRRARAFDPGCRWRLLTVPGVDHDYARMIPATQARWDELVGD